MGVICQRIYTMLDVTNIFLQFRHIRYHEPFAITRSSVVYIHVASLGDIVLDWQTKIDFGR